MQGFGGVRGFGGFEGFGSRICSVLGALLRASFCLKQ